MKKIILTAILMGAASAGAKATNASQGQFYLSIPVGYGITTQPSKDSEGLYSGKFKKPVIFGLAGGYDFNILRAELSWNNRSKMDLHAFRNTSTSILTESQSVKVNTFMANIYKDFHVSDKFSPYVTAGLGFSNIKGGTVFTSDHYPDIDTTFLYEGAGSSENRFSWQLGLGAAYNVTETVSLDLSYRYTYLGKVTGTDPILEEVASYKLKSNDIMFNLRIKL